MRQESNQSPQDLSLKLYNIKQQKVTEHPQAHVVAANFKRQRYKQGGLRALGKEGYSQKNLLSGKANVSTSLQVVSKIKRKSGKKGLDYQKSKHTVCSGRHKQGQDVQLKRLGQTSHSGKSLQLKKVSEELKKQCLRRKRKRDEFDENDTFRIKKRVKYLINRMNKEQNLIDAYSTEGWKGQSREKLRPERELQKARSQILRLQLAIREAVKELDLLGSEGTMKEYIFNSYGQIYHEDIFCAICKRQDVMTNNDIILCDGACDRAFHQLCLEPALKTDES
ncbi:hypothetical protein KP509_1Z301800 [Ceratopteris richardii]|nr:hypothetical protein KP509_1Z301800 [Ceratopteris richardii]